MGVVRYAKNPFMTNENILKCKKDFTWKNKTIGRVKAEWDLMNKQTGEVYEVRRTEHELFCGTRIQSDVGEFVKMYACLTPIVRKFEKIGSIKVLAVLLERIRGKQGIDKDEFKLTWNDLTDEEKEDIKKTSFHEGFNELIKWGIIARSTHAGYIWINPMMIWNGKRITFITTYECNDGKDEPQNDLKQIGTNEEEGKKEE